MKKITGRLLALSLAAAAALSVTIITAYAKDDKSSKAHQKASTAVSQTVAVTLDEAKAIALSHAGADAAEAVFTKEKLDKSVYELKFSDSCGKYEYEISAVNGAVLDYEWDIKVLRSAIPLELAEEIALNHAGVDAADAVFTKEKLDKAVYELKFSDENGKYEYEISAVNGTILDYEWDIRTPAGTAPSAPEPCFSWEAREQAGQTALEDAGVSREALKYLVCYVSWRGRVPVAYEVKFATSQAAYRYTIDLDTGAILESACYPHH